MQLMNISAVIGGIISCAHFTVANVIYQFSVVQPEEA